MRHVLVVMFILGLNLCVMAQEKPLVSVSLNQTELDVGFASGNPIPRKFAQQRASDVTNYVLYELEPADSPGTVSQDKTELLQVSECIGFNCQALRMRLKAPLHGGQTYILVLKSFTDNEDSVTTRFDVKSSPAPIKATLTKGPDAYNQRTQLTLRAPAPITVVDPIEVQRSFLKLKPDNSGYTEDSEIIKADVDPRGDKLFILKLHSKLSEGQDLKLFISNGITVKDIPDQPVRAEGAFKLTGLPTKPEDIRLDLNLAGVAAVHQKPVFDLTAKFIPTRVYQVGDTEWIWEPTFKVDVGLRSTKSANSVVLAPLNFSNYLGENLKAFRPGPKGVPPVLLTKHRDGTNQPSYANWMATPWYRPSDVKLTLGPKGEFDRNFRRKNVLGSVRFDFDFHRWRSSIADRRRLLEADWGEAVAKAIRLNFGWSLVPYVAVDFGEHVNNETVSNTKKKASVLIARHGILRGYFGFVTAFESNRFNLPISLTIDEAVFYLAHTEVVGLVTDAGVETRRLHGIQHRGKAVFSFALDPAKHYSLTLSYENGRVAPNFEYLNKFTSGFRVVFW